MVEKHREFILESLLPPDVVRKKSTEFWEPKAQRNSFAGSEMGGVFRIAMRTKLTPILIVHIDLVIVIAPANGKTHVVVGADLNILRPI